MIHIDNIESFVAEDNSNESTIARLILTVERLIGKIGGEETESSDVVLQDMTEGFKQAMIDTIQTGITMTLH